MAWSIGRLLWPRLPALRVRGRQEVALRKISKESTFTAKEYVDRLLHHVMNVKYHNLFLARKTYLVTNHSPPYVEHSQERDYLVWIASVEFYLFYILFCLCRHLLCLKGGGK